MSYTRDAAESTIRRLLVQLDEAHMLVVERFVVEQCLAQQSGHQSGGSLAGLVGGESGNTRPNQAGADGNGAAGQTFSPVPSGLSPEHSHTDGTGTFSARGRCRCNREQGDSDCDVHPGCDGCGVSLIDHVQYTSPPWKRLCLECYCEESKKPVNRGLRELRDAPAVKAAPMGVMLDFEMPEVE